MLKNHWDMLRETVNAQHETKPLNKKKRFVKLTYVSSNLEKS